MYRVKFNRFLLAPDIASTCNTQRYGRYLIVNKGRKLGRTRTRMCINIQLIHNLPCFKYEWMREAQSARMPFGKNIQFNTVPASGGNLVDNLSDILVNIPDH